MQDRLYIINADNNRFIPIAYYLQSDELIRSLPKHKAEVLLNSRNNRLKAIVKMGESEFINSLKDIKLRIGMKIAQERCKKNITSLELSQLSGLSATYISRIEKGQINLTISTLQTVLRPLGLDIDFKKIKETD